MCLMKVEFFSDAHVKSVCGPIDSGTTTRYEPFNCVRLCLHTSLSLPSFLCLSYPHADPKLQCLILLSLMLVFLLFLFPSFPPPLSSGRVDMTFFLGKVTLTLSLGSHFGRMGKPHNGCADPIFFLEVTKQP